MRAFPSLLLASMFLLQAPALGAHCTTHSTSTTDLERGMVVVDLYASPERVPFVGYFFYDFGCQVDETCLFHMGTYTETNGLPGLQRRDALADDTCHGLVKPDLYTWT